MTFTQRACYGAVREPRLRWVPETLPYTISYARKPRDIRASQIEEEAQHVHELARKQGQGLRSEGGNDRSKGG